jgi:hypothetical protein
MNNLEKIKKFIELRSEGHSLREISKIIDKSTRTLVKWNKKYCTVVFEVQAGELKTFKQKILEEKKSRLEYLNLNYSKIKDKLEHSEIIMRYDKMLALLIKLSKSIDDCQKNIILSEISEELEEGEENVLKSEEVNAFGEEKNSLIDVKPEKKLEYSKENE